PYALLAFAVVAAAVFHVSTFHATERLFRATRIPRQLRPMVGAALTGVVVVAAYWWCDRDIRLLSGFSSGYGVLQQSMSDLGSITISLLLVIAVVKVVATSLTIGSGGSGGVFGPSMVIGGAVGGSMGKLLHGVWPQVVAQPEALTIVGMAGFFAACANAPFSTVLMVCELTGNYKLLVPTVWVAVIAYGFCRQWSLYPSQVDSPLDSPAHNGDFTVDLLEGMLVDEVYKPRVLISFRDNASLEEIVHSLTKTTQRYFPVYDESHRLVGIFSADDVRLSLYDELLWKVANASDVMVERVVTVTTDDDLNTALNRFTALNVDELPVIAPGDPNHILGVLRRKETIAAYNRRRLEVARVTELEER
ncbi:MAG: chloride channel protein, partial [Planctomycetota bacterium]